MEAFVGFNVLAPGEFGAGVAYGALRPWLGPRWRRRNGIEVDVIDFWAITQMWDLDRRWRPLCAPILEVASKRVLRVQVNTSHSVKERHRRGGYAARCLDAVGHDALLMVDSIACVWAVDEMQMDGIWGRSIFASREARRG